jgi:hypothetical protein
MRNVKSKTNGTKRYAAMTSSELRTATKQYDIPTTSNRLPGRPLTPAQQRVWEKVRRPGRPRVGQGVEVISLSVEKGLLKLADATAKSQGISRAELFARGLKKVIPRQKSNGRAA